MRLRSIFRSIFFSKIWNGENRDVIGVFPISPDFPKYSFHF